MKAYQHYQILIRPILTEKSALASSSNWYAFVVSPRAEKKDIIKAVSSIYSVDVESVNIVNKRTRYEKTFRGVIRKRPSVKKAYVKLKTGQTINIQGV